jgi:hypothetical protein
MAFVAESVSRRAFLTGSAVAGLSLMSQPVSADETIHLGLPGGVDTRDLITDFPEKRTMILQRTVRPCLKRHSKYSTRTLLRPTINSMFDGIGPTFRVRWMQTPFGSRYTGTSIRLSACRSEICSRCRRSISSPSINVQAIRAASSSHACRARNGPMARWGTRGGPGYC